jgi:hypothetical protein
MQFAVIIVNQLVPTRLSIAIMSLSHGYTRCFVVSQEESSLISRLNTHTRLHSGFIVILIFISLIKFDKVCTFSTLNPSL